MGVGAGALRDETKKRLCWRLLAIDTGMDIFFPFSRSAGGILSILYCP